MRRKIWTFLGCGVLAAAGLLYLRALRSLGDPGDVRVYQRIAADARLEVKERGEAWMKIVAIGGEEAVRVLAELEAEPLPTRSVLMIPSPIPLLPWIAKQGEEEPIPDDAGAMEGYFHRSELRRYARGSALLRLPDLSQLVLYRGTAIGGEDDLWLARLTEDGKIAAGPWFTGQSLMMAKRRETTALSLNGEMLTVASSGGSVKFSIDLRDIASDRDHDGLTDLVEARLRLDPQNPDSDGDGLTDDVDPAPNARIPRPTTDEEARRLAVVEQFLRLTPYSEPRSDHSAMIVWNESALEWRGRGGPTITLPPEQFGEFLDSAGEDGIGHLTIRPWETSRWRAAEYGRDPCRLLKIGETAYEVEMYFGGLSAAGYCAIVRPLAGRWYIRHLRGVWIS